MCSSVAGLLLRLGGVRVGVNEGRPVSGPVGVFQCGGGVVEVGLRGVACTLVAVGSCGGNCYKVCYRGYCGNRCNANCGVCCCDRRNVSGACWTVSLRGLLLLYKAENTSIFFSFPFQTFCGNTYCLHFCELCDSLACSGQFFFSKF